jgi:uncharacterized damage-inducible protein DinB
MKKAGLLVVCIFLPFLAEAQQSTFLQEMARRLQNSKASSLQIAALMPEEGYHFKPVAGEMDFAEQLLHMAQNISWLTSTYLANEPDIFTKEQLQRKEKNKTEIMQIMTKAFDYAILTTSRFDEARLEEVVKFGAGPLSKRQVLMLINDHQTHHRGQLIVYLRLNHIQPPKYVGW